MVIDDKIDVNFRSKNPKRRKAFAAIHVQIRSKMYSPSASNSCSEADFRMKTCAPIPPEMLLGGMFSIRRRP